MTDTIPAAVQAAAVQFGDATALAEPGGPVLSYRGCTSRCATWRGH